MASKTVRVKGALVGPEWKRKKEGQKVEHREGKKVE